MSPDSPGEPILSDRWMTLPNCLTALRIVGSPGLVILGILGQPIGLAVLAAVLVLTEWLDGLLARRLGLETSTGARLDTIADAVFYSSMLVGLICLVPERVGGEWFWIALAIGSYGSSWLVSRMKFGRLPSYHTWMAKAAWVFVLPGILLLALGWDQLLFRFSMVFVTLANLEAIAITSRLSSVRVDVPSIWHLLYRDSGESA